MDNTKNIVKNVGSTIADGVKEGAKLAAASEFNDLLVGVISKVLVEQVGVEKDTLENPLVNGLLKIAAPVILITLVEMFGDKIPQAKNLKAAAEIALTAVSYEEIGKLLAPLMGMIVPLLKSATSVTNPDLLGLGSGTQSQVDAVLHNAHETAK